MDGQWFASVLPPLALTGAECLQVDERRGLAGGWVGAVPEYVAVWGEWAAGVRM